MDFWSRLIAGTSLSPSTAKKASAQDPNKRLARFKREHNQLVQIWRNSSNLSRDQDAAESVRLCIQGLTAILSDEARRPSPHLCISFACTKQIYVSIGKIATVSYSEPIIREAVGFFSTLIESEEEDFLDDEDFSQSLMNLLVRITGANSIRLGLDTEVEVVELAFGIAAKIRLQPEILPAWFRTHEEDSSDGHIGEHEKFAGKTHKEDFPLFYLLIDYIHHEGRVGDFARTGLLYIIESASTSMPLEQWIVESDLATLMSTGLGALYSQLSRKLVIDYPPQNLPPILALSDYQHPVTTSHIISSASPDFQGHMDTFLSHLVFWQDVLEHCKSVEVKQTLLEHFQVIFLQQLLYPSLLESSDIDGGSSVAVLTYLRRILESLEHPDMIHLILHYLLALPDTAAVIGFGTRKVSAARKRKSMDLATMMAAQAEIGATPTIFNLVDLILGSLQSKNQQTVSVTLQLISVLLRRHHRYAVTTLVKAGRTISEESQRPIGVHEFEMEFLLTLAGEINTDQSIDEAYENHVKDSMLLLESHPCSQILINPKPVNGTAKFPGAQASIPGAPKDVRTHTLRHDDPLLKSLLNVLETFFINPVETNLSLTEAIIDLAACGFMNITGWLVPDPIKYIYDEDLDDESEPLNLIASPRKDEQEQMRAVYRAQCRPSLPDASLPPLLLLLRTLTSQVLMYRDSVPRFDDLLLQRRMAFQMQTLAQDAPFPVHQSARSSLESIASRSVSPAPAKPSAFDSLAQRIFPPLASPSRSKSPRGRKGQERGTATVTPIITPISNKQGIMPPPQSPLLAETPNLGKSRAFSPSPLRMTENTVEESHALTFKEADRGILSMKIGIPGRSDVSKAAQVRTSDVVLREAEESSSEEDGGANQEEGAADDTKPGEKIDGEGIASVSHVLTNVIVLQEFLLELAALVQVRAGLFGEVRFV
ncbi:MAG: hypothetical protein M1818_007901 [Claussenomyces sp. TS43310]|nr:MAG: hypothetical protein M1818_007901 [Claussenomyces sp. TS43310]